MSLPCVVLGGSITALGVVRSLGRAGLTPIVVSPRGDLASRSRWAERHIADIPETDNPETVVRALTEHGLARAVLFPCSDTWAQAVARMSDAARERYPASISGPDVLDTLVDKALFHAAAVRLDIPVPPTRIIVSASEIEPSEYNGFFLKPSNSQRFNALFSDKAFTFSNEAEAREGLRLMAAAGVDALLQEYIPGPPTEHYFIDGYLDREEILRALFVRQRTRMFPVAYGNSTHMVTVAPGAAEQAVTDITRFLRGLGFYGTFSAEFKRDPRDGTFRILEVNGRPWWYIGFAADCGLDIVQLSYREALGLELQTVETYRTGVRCVLLHLDVRAFLYERRERGLTFGAWLRSVVGVRSAVFAWSDPRPALYFVVGGTKNHLRAAISTEVRKLLHRGI
ncbi:MAG: hypothetical protein WCJ67_02450 [Thermoleophilia bacterium]